jgi:hypothetical protein
MIWSFVVRIAMLRKQVAEKMVNPLPSIVDAWRWGYVNATAFVFSGIRAIGRMVILRNVGQRAEKRVSKFWGYIGFRSAGQS